MKGLKYNEKTGEFEPFERKNPKSYSQPPKTKDDKSDIPIFSIFTFIYALFCILLFTFVCYILLLTILDQATNIFVPIFLRKIIAILLVLIDGFIAYKCARTEIS